MGEAAPDIFFEGLIAVEEILAKAVGVSEVAQIARTETRLRQFLEAKWKVREAQALKKAVSMAKQLRPAGEIAKAVGKILKRWVDDVSPRFEKDFKKMYRLARVAGWKKARGDSRASLAYDIPKLEPVEKIDIWKRLWSTSPKQPVSSLETGVKTLPAVFSKAEFQPGTINADIGGGQYETATEFLAEQDVENVVFDPFARSKKENEKAIERIRDGQAASAVVANVLNVIRSSKNRETVIRQAANAVGKDGVAYFQVYEGDGSGKWKRTSKGWQANQSLDYFEPEIRRHFSSVERRDGYLEARQKVEKVKILKTDATLLAEINPSFDLIDVAAADALSENQVFWIGEHYDKNLAAGIANTSKTAMIEAGMDRIAAGKLMQRQMGRQFGIVQTPAGWRGTSRGYFEGLAANAATTARVQGQMRSFVDLGVTRYQISNPIDERTCPPCAHMDGKVINIEHGMKVMEAELGAESPEDVKKAHPWVQDSKAGMEKLKEYAPKRGEQKNEAKREKESKNLGDAGLSLPPFHFRCRCTVDVSYQAGSFHAMTPLEKPPPAPKKVPPSTAKHIHRLKVASDLMSPVKSVAALEAQSANETMLVIVETPKKQAVKGVFKPASGEYRGLRPNIQTGTFYQREALMSELDVELGGPNIVPTTVARKVKGEVGSYQKWVDDAKDYKDVRSAVASSADFFIKDPRARKMHLMDVLAANDDRHQGNIMFQWVKDKKGRKVLKVWAIDNGLTFPAGSPARFLSPFPDKTYRAFRRLDDASIKMIKELDDRVYVEMMKKHGMEKKAARGALQRLEALRTDPHVLEEYSLPERWGRKPDPEQFFIRVEEHPEKFVPKKKLTEIEKLLDEVYGK